MAGILPKSIPPCPQWDCLIAAGLQSKQILLPDSDDYEERIESYWSSSAKLRPACIVQPQSATEVASVVKALATAGLTFAIRSGGSNFSTASNNISSDGVTIDLGQMASIVFDPEREIAHIGPAARWGQVYAALSKYGRAVAGGREGSVGVAGLLLGGGNTFFTARLGFACDTVLAYEVVLADGRVIVAGTPSGEENEQHADLFHVLKGGGNNFGIVTKFTMRTIPCSDIWGGGAIMIPSLVMPRAVHNFVDFTNNIQYDPDSNLIFMLGHLSSAQEPNVVIATLYANMAGVEKPPIFERFLAFPEALTTYKKTTITDLLTITAQPTGYYAIWFTLCIKNDVSIITKAAELHDALVTEMVDHISNRDFKSKCIFQPLPRLFGERSLETGGNIMGIERHTEEGILWQIDVMVRTKDLQNWVFPHVHAVYEGVRTFAEGSGGLLEWINLNYAHPTQKVLQSYGEANLGRMRQVAARYDPNGVFQRLCPGGFKLAAT